MELIGVSSSTKRDKAMQCLRTVFTEPLPNARPMGLYLAHSWVLGREIGAEREEWKRVGGDADEGMVAVPR